jgi:DNA-binding transcriptional MerR regulator
MSEPFSIQDLSDKTGVPRRTIHFYTQQGILPPPLGAGLAAKYDETHLLRLQLIPVLRSEGLRLDQIRERFQEMNPADLSDLFRRSQAKPLPAPKVVSIPRPEIYSHYVLPSDIQIIAPQNLNTDQQEKLTQLLREADRIFNQNNRD